MSTMQTTPPDFSELRSKVRRTQHARSIPLLVIGALLVNYAVVSFASQPVAWRYGAPLAFLLVWAFGKLNEARVGVGTGRADYLVASGAVFIATNLLLLDTTLRGGDRLHQLFGAWVIIVGVALAVLALPVRDAVLLVAGLAVVAVGVVMFIYSPPIENLFQFGGADSFNRTWTLWLMALVGTALGIAGLVLYRRERVDA